MTHTEEQTSPLEVHKKRRKSWVGWIALVAILIALACWFQLVHQQKRSTKNYSQLQSSFHQTLSDTAVLGQTINNLQTQITTQGAQIQAMQAALNLLQAADQRLNSVSDPEVIALRQMIASTTIKLQSLAPIDYVGILSKLSALRDQTAHIPLFSASSKTQVFYTQTEATVPTPTMTWQNALRKTVEMLKSLVVIR